MILNDQNWNETDLAARIDHTVLAPDATREHMEKACDLACSYGFKAVFTNPYWTPFVAKRLEGSGIAAGISAAFPLGALSTRCKVMEILDVVESLDGKPCAVDMVANLSLLKEQRYTAYTADIRAVVEALSGRNIPVKAIIETALLDDEEIRTASRCAAEAGVDYVKTSTGRSGPPKLTDIQVMKSVLPSEVGIKFSGFGTHNGPELALWAFLFGADVLGSPQGNVIVDTLCLRYANMRAAIKQ